MKKLPYNNQFQQGYIQQKKQYNSQSKLFYFKYIDRSKRLLNQLINQIRKDNRRQNTGQKLKIMSKQKYQQEQELQISQFIKDPNTLKLLILAGTNIRSTQLQTVAKCTNLIKLDLSCNMLSDVPISFSNFVQLKILYLHQNNIFSVNVEKTTIQYLTLFKNPFKNYRSKIVATNQKLMAIDYNIVTRRQKLGLYDKPPHFTQIKWPIVETASTLQSQEDYLNLLKAQIFVITNLYKKATSIQKLQNYILSYAGLIKYKRKIEDMTDEMKLKKANVTGVVYQWKKYVKQKQKLRIFLAQRGKQSLLYNRLDVRRLKRSPKTNQIIQNFIKSIRLRLNARKVLQPVIKSYRQYIPISKKLVQIYKFASNKQKPFQRLYFLKSQIHSLQKIFLYCKRLLFNKKQYDLCDNFDKIVSKDKKEYYLFRGKQRNFEQKLFLLDSIRRSMWMILGEKGMDRKYLLYSRKGHKKIGLKNREKLKFTNEQKKQLKQKMNKITQKIGQKYESYDSLISYSINDDKLYELLLKIIRYFNAGNYNTILSNQAAYFQTQVIFQDEEEKQKRQKIYVGLEFFVRRTLAANVIQKSWRKIQSKKKSQVNVIKTLRQKRAKNMISHWIRGLGFQQRTKMNKILWSRKALQKTNDLYIQLQIYLKLPKPTNLLKLQKYEDIQNKTNQCLYEILHKDSVVQIVQLGGRKWVRIIFSTIQKAMDAYKMLLYATFKFYYNGFYIRLFSYFQAQQDYELLTYQKRVKHLFDITISVSKQALSSRTSTSKKLPIQNLEPFFVWAELGEKGIQTKYQIPSYTLPISMFIYNKHQKPLKVNCDLNWINPGSIYHNKRHVVKSSLHGTSIRSRTPTKKSSFTEQKSTNSFILPGDIQNHYISKMRSNQKRDRRSSQISPHNTILLKNHLLRKRGASEHIQVDLLSQTLNIRKK